MKHLVHFSSVVAVVTLHLTHVTDLTVCERVLEVGRNRLAPHGQLANGAHVAMRTEDDDLAGMFGLQALQAVKSQTPPRWYDALRSEACLGAKGPCTNTKRNYAGN